MNLLQRTHGTHKILSVAFPPSSFPPSDSTRIDSWSPLSSSSAMRVKKQHNGNSCLTGRCLVRTAVGLWLFGVTASVYIFSSRLRTLDTHVLPSDRIADSKLSKSQVLQKQKASLVNQAWLERKFKLGQKMESAAEGASDGYQLPSWLAQKQEQKRNPEQYLAENHPTFEWNDSCQGFNFTYRRPTHGCQLNKDTMMVHCSFENLRVDLSKIQSDRGGEVLGSVMGREEGPEIPSYQMGAFAVATRPKHVPIPITEEYPGKLQYLQQVVNAMEYPEKGQPRELKCMKTFKGTTMFLTRYEYVNLYHTMTDWWNTYFSLPDEPVLIVFLDAHAEGNLDPVWTQLFGPTTFVQHLPKGGACFEKAVMIPSGYAAPIYPKEYRKRCTSQRMAEEFCQHVLRKYRLEHVRMIPGKIVLIERIPYVSHPRSKPENAQRIISNMKDLQKRLQKIPQVSSVEIVQFENMSFGEQVSKVREANVLIGNHGAGLTHVMFMESHAHLLELTGEMHDFFIYLSDWKGVEHSSIPIWSEANKLSEPDIDQVAEKVSSLLHAA